MYPKYEVNPYPVSAPQYGRTILLLGTSADGPVNVPVPITTPTRAQQIFGEEGTLYKKFVEAYDTNSGLLIYLMRISGEHAEAELFGFPSMFEDAVSVLKLKAIYGGEAYNNIQAIFQVLDADGDVSLTLSFPEHTGLSPLSYKLSTYGNIAMLVKAINEDTRAGINCLRASTLQPELPTSSLLGMGDVIEFSGGADGLELTKNDMFIALEYAYTLLDGFYIDVIIPLGVYLDDVDPVLLHEVDKLGPGTYVAGRDYLDLKDTENGDRLVSFHGQLIKFCKRQVRFGVMTHGVIGLNPVADISQIEGLEYNYILYLLQQTAFRSRFDISEFSGGNWIDSGYYVSVIGGEMIFNEGTDNEYFGDWTVVYGALLASLGRQYTTTNLKIPGPVKPRYHFTSGELGELGRMGVVAMRESVRNGLVVSSGVTAALPESDMHSIANVRQVQTAIAALNQALDDYSGELILPLIENGTLDEVAESVLSELKNEGILIDYRKNIEYDRIRGTGILSVDLLARQMVDFLPVRASLSFSGLGG